MQYLYTIFNNTSCLPVEQSTLKMSLQGTTLTFVATCPVGQVTRNFHLPHSNFQLPLKNCMFYNVSPSRTWYWHVKENFLGQVLMPDHKTCTHSQK